MLKDIFHLQWLSLRLTQYFNQHDQNLPAVFPPEPHKIIECIILEQIQWEPNLTDVFMSHYNLRAFMGLHTTTMTVGSTLSGASAVSCLTTSTAVTALSGTAPALATNASVCTGSMGVCIENMHFNTTLFGPYRTSTVKSKVLWQKIERCELPPLPPSKLDATKPVCIA